MEPNNPDEHASQPLSDEYPELTELIHDPRFFLLLGLLLSHRKAQPAGRVSRLLKHPAILLILGFLLTVLVGGALASYWKSREWRHQQDYLVAQKEVSDKQKLVDDVISSIGDTLASADDISSIYSYEWNPQEQEAEIGERKKAWYQSSRKWRSASEVLRWRLAMNFGKGDADIFQTIVYARYRQGVAIANLVGTGLSPKKEKERQGYSDEALKERNLVSNLTQQLGGDLAAGVRAALARPREPLHWWLF